MKKVTQVPAGPAHIIAGITPGWDKVRILDADTGEQIERVIEVDTAKGVVRRHQVANGSLVVKDGDFVVIEEERAVRIEAIDVLTEAAAA